MKTFVTFGQRRVEVSTLTYEFSHGKQPSGRGCWGFFLNHRDGELIWAPPNLTYVAAKKRAARIALDRGIPRIVVAP